MYTLGTPGQVISDRYRLETRGESLPFSTTDVWIATDTLLGTSVRIILLDPKAPSTPDALDAARRAALFDDVHAIRVLSVSDALIDGPESSKNPPFICTEIPPGMALDQLMLGPIAPSQVHAITGEVASALAQARDHGLRHLELRPDFIRIGSQGEVYIEGLGIAAPLSGVASDSVFGIEADRLEVRGIVDLAALLLLDEHETTSTSIARALAIEGLPAPLQDVLQREQSDQPFDTPAALARALAPWPPIDLRPLASLPTHAPVPSELGANARNAGALDPELGIPAAPPVELHPNWAPVESAQSAELPEPEETGPASTSEQPEVTPPPEPATEETQAAVEETPAPIEKVPPVAEEASPVAEEAPTAHKAAPQELAPTRISDSEPHPAPRSLALPTVHQTDVKKPSVEEAFTMSSRPNPTDRRYNPTKVIVAVAAVLVVVGGAWAVSTFFRPTEPVATATSTATATPSTTATSSASQTPTPTATTEQAEDLPSPTISDVTLLNPHADLLVTNETSEQDTPANLPYAWDGNSSTSWRSWWYSTQDFAGKGGIGLEIKLTAKSKVTEVELLTNTTGGNVQWRKDATAEQPESGSVLVEGAMSADTQLKADTAQATDTIILWFNELPVDSQGQYRIDISEINVK